MHDPQTSPTDATTDRPIPLALLWGVLLTLCVTGYTFGQSNHHVYLLDAIRFGHPELLSRDWFVTHTLQYHYSFTLLTVALQKLHLLTAGFFLIYLGLVVAMHAAWLSIVRSIGGDTRVYLLSVLLYHLSGGGLGLGVYQILQDGSVLPSNFAAVATLGAIAFWLRRSPNKEVSWRRTLGLAACVGVAGSFHVNYALALVVAWTGLSLLSAVRARSLRGLIAPRAIVATLIALLPCTYNVGTALLAARENSAEIPIAEFVAVYVRLRHSHHHEPLAWPAALWISFLWPLPLAAWALWRLPPSRVRTDVAVLLGAVLAVLTFAVLFAGVWYVNASIVKLSLFRFSPFAKLLSCVLAAWLLIYGSTRVRRTLGPLLVIVGIGLLATLLFRGHWPTSVPLPTVGLLVGASLLTLWLAIALLRFEPLAVRTVGSRELRLVLSLLLIGGLPVCVALAAQQRLGVAMPGERDAEMAAVCAWARTSTPVDALFLVPPHDQSFPLAARRAEVVGFKHVPQLSAELVEWKRRLDAVLDMDVAGLPTPMPRTMAAMADRYASLSADHLSRVAAKYDCDYLIAMRPLAGDAWTARHVFASPGGRYHVYRLR